MLKNKFGMLKVLALALSVLMLVSLAACGNKGVAEEDMNAAIQAALDAQASADASKLAAVEASLKAEQDAANAAAAAAQSSLAAAQAEASKAAAEASKAAADAEKKASEAAASASKAQSEASKAAAEASKAQVEATRTTTTKATETTAPIVVDKDAIAAVQAEFAKLKHEYTYTNEGLYLADNYAELTLLFDKAAVELQNALTKEAAESILATLKVEAAAIENAQSRADAVQVLVADLGDIESELFTTQAEKITAANKALSALKKDYNKKSGMDQALLAEVIEDTINTADLTKANAKLVVLNDYIAAALWEDMETLYKADPKGKFDAEDDYKGATEDLIDRAYYMYRVLAVINGTDTAAADLPIDWEYAVNDEGETVTAPEGYTHPITGKTLKYKLDFDAPTEYFYVEDLVDIYFLPSLDVKFAGIKAVALDALKAHLNEARYNTFIALTNNVVGTTKEAVAPWSDISDVFEEAVDAFEAELDTLSYVGDYKGANTIEDATEDVYTRYMKAYIAGINGIIEGSKANTIEIYEEDVRDVNIAKHEKNYEDEKYAATLAAKLELEEANYLALVENVNAAPSFDYDALNAEELLAKYGVNKKTPAPTLDEYYDYDTATIANSFYAFVDKVVADAINANFKTTVIEGTQTGMLSAVVATMAAELEEFRLKFLDEDSANYTALRGAAIAYLEDVHVNDEKLVALNTIIDEQIAALYAIDVATYTDKENTIMWFENEVQGKSFKKAKLYFINEAAKNYVETEGLTEVDFMTVYVLNQDGTRMKDAAGKDVTTYYVSGDALTQVEFMYPLSDYFTTTDTGLPYTYTLTAEDQAILAAQTAYVAALKAIHAQIMSLINTSELNTVADYQAQITDNSGYKAALSNASGDTTLKGEIEKVGNSYINAISGTAFYRAINTGYDEDGDVSKFASYSDYMTVGEHVKFNADAKDHAEKYSLANIDSYMSGRVSAFLGTKNLYNQVITNYNNKLNAIKELTAAVEGYKNRYTLVEEDGELKGYYLVTRTTTGYKYDDADKTVGGKEYVKEISADVIAYHEALDAILDTAVAEINKVVITSGKTTIKDGVGSKVVADKKGENSAAKCLEIINAVKKAVLTGKSDITVYALNDSNKTPYAHANSRIFVKFNTLILKNFSGVRDVRADKTIEITYIQEGLENVIVKYDGTKALKAGEEVPEIVAKAGFVGTWTIDWETETATVTYVKELTASFDVNGTAWADVKFGTGSKLPWTPKVPYGYTWTAKNVRVVATDKPDEYKDVALKDTKVENQLVSFDVVAK